jgi:hypothetical protein
MKNKILLSFFAMIFLVVVFSGLISAAVSFVNTTNTVVTVNQGNSVTMSFQAKEGGYGNLTNITFNTPLTLTKGSDSFSSVTSITGVITSLNQSLTSGFMSLVFNVPSTQAAGVYTGNLTLSGKYTDEVNYNLPITITVTQPSNSTDFESNFCVFEKGTAENPGNLGISVKNDVTIGYGDNSNWYPLDEVELTIKVDNNGDEDVNDISLEWGIYDSDTKDWVKEVDEEDSFDLDNGDDDSYTITFKLDDSDLDVDLSDLERGDNYVIYARITGKIASGSLKGIKTCDWESRSVDINIDRDFVVLSDFNLPESVSCGDTLTINADVWNIGTRDENAVTVNVAIKDLKYAKPFEIGDINSFDSEGVEFSIPIPNDAQEKSYLINFEVYDEDRNIFENDNNDKSAFSRLIKVAGCGVSPSGEESNVVVSADLESGGKAGQSLSINTVITNTGDKELALALNAAGYAQWANSVDLDRDSLTLKAGESGNVKFVFDVKSDVTGDQLFTIEVISGKEVVATQPVSVFIEGKSSGLSDLFGGNWYLWILGLVNVILVVLIIVVAIRVARKKK